jgi:hypothetical protein
LPTEKYPGDEENEGSVLHFDGGYITNFTFFPHGKTEGEPLPNFREKDPEKLPSIFANFIECVRSRKQSDLTADILEGHYSSALCHLANVSYRLGSEVPFRPLPEFGTDFACKETFEKMEQHLVSTVNIKLDSDRLRFGRTLMLDASGEGVLGDSQAGSLMTRAYRAPFTVPDKV